MSIRQSKGFTLIELLIVAAPMALSTPRLAVDPFPESLGAWRSVTSGRGGFING